jgi:hypothetical protein
MTNHHGFFEDLFSQYDRIVSHAPHGAPNNRNSAPSDASAAAPAPPSDSVPSDLPPWWSPQLENHDGNDEDRMQEQIQAPLPPEGPSRAAELGAGVLGALSRIPKGPVPGSGFAQAATADEAAAFARINRAASPYLQSISPEFARAAEADRVAALARIRGYATPALRAGAGEALAGEAALGLAPEAALGLAPVAGGLAAGLAGMAALDAYGRYTQAKNKEFTSAVQPGEVSFSVDGGTPFDPYRPKKKAP